MQQGRRYLGLEDTARALYVHSDAEIAERPRSTTTGSFLLRSLETVLMTKNEQNTDGGLYAEGLGGCRKRCGFPIMASKVGKASRFSDAMTELRPSCPDHRSTLTRPDHPPLGIRYTAYHPSPPMKT